MNLEDPTGLLEYNIVCVPTRSSPHRYESQTPINPWQEDTGVHPFQRELWLPCRMDTHVHSSPPAQPINHQFNSDQQPDPKDQVQYQIFEKSTVGIDSKSSRSSALQESKCEGKLTGQKSEMDNINSSRDSF